MRPINNNIFVREVEREQQGAIILPVDDRNYKVGIVAYVDSEHLNVGDKVIFSKVSAKEFNHDGETLLTVPENGVFGVLSEN